MGVKFKSGKVVIKQTSPNTKVSFGCVDCNGCTWADYPHTMYVDFPANWMSNGRCTNCTEANGTQAIAVYSPLYHFCEGGTRQINTPYCYYGGINIQIEIKVPPAVPLIWYWQVTVVSKLSDGMFQYVWRKAFAQSDKYHCIQGNFGEGEDGRMAIVLPLYSTLNGINCNASPPANLTMWYLPLNFSTDFSDDFLGVE